MLFRHVPTKERLEETKRVWLAEELPHLGLAPTLHSSIAGYGNLEKVRIHLVA